ncbi:MAG: FMN-binding negative transcriptional regulator [Hyphomonadaceae bacterium]|nr:FMN-binding negative transcriptional regulator [Hyphomonadaceae bacterium]
MYALPAFRVDDTSDLAAFIEARRFATLIVSGESGPQAAHIPMIINRDATGAPVSLEGHVARGNPVAGLSARPTRALAIFSGADAYVTPSLYLSKREHGKVVPTWNYIAIHVAGVVEAFSNADALRQQVSRITDLMEQPATAPWAVSDAPEDYISKMLNAITGVRLTIDAIEGVRKLSQNRPEGDRAGVLNGLTRSSDPSARQLAAEMTKEA